MDIITSVVEIHVAADVMHGGIVTAGAIAAVTLWVLWTAFLVGRHNSSRDTYCD